MTRIEPEVWAARYQKRLSEILYADKKHWTDVFAKECIARSVDVFADPESKAFADAMVINHSNEEHLTAKTNAPEWQRKPNHPLKIIDNGEVFYVAFYGEDVSGPIHNRITAERTFNRLYRAMIAGIVQPEILHNRYPKIGGKP